MSVYPRLKGESLLLQSTANIGSSVKVRACQRATAELRSLELMRLRCLQTKHSH